MEQLCFEITEMIPKKRSISMKELFEDAFEEDSFLDFRDIEDIEELEKHSDFNFLKLDRRSKINIVVRYISSKLNVSFSSSWQSIYRVANYKMKVNVRARGVKSKSLISSFSEKELVQFEEIVRDWAFNKGFNYEKILSLWR